MKPVLRPALWFSLVGGAAVIVSIFVAPGCTTWRTRDYGDAKLRRENYHFRSIGIGVMPEWRDFLSLPEVSLDAPATNVFFVRNFPTNQSVPAFTLVLPKTASHTREAENTVLPWHQARVHLIARDTNGLELFTRRIALDNLPRWNWETRAYEARPGRRGWNDAWDLAGLAEALGGRRGYDLIVVVEKPSTEKKNTIQIRGTGTAGFGRAVNQP